MMKLKYLFDNRELVKMLLGYWEHDENELDILNHYRISSNAIYPFKDKGQVKLLRLAPAFEKTKNNLMAELEFIKYLSLNGYPALKTILSKGSEELVTAETPWGNYYATAFERVRGVQISNTDLNNTIIFEYGKALGKLHRLSSRYSPLHKRWSYSDVLSWINSILTEFEKQELALKEVNLLQGHLSKLSKTTENYGLVHYDFELDNVFYDKEVCSCNVIDFDDAMYHWYVMDVEQALDSIKEEVEPIKYEQAKDCFLNGYRNEYTITDEMLSLQPIFRRFADLYSYTRILRASNERWQNEPNWLTDLRTKLDIALKHKTRYFGTAL